MCTPPVGGCPKDALGRPPPWPPPPWPPSSFLPILGLAFMVRSTKQRTVDNQRICGAAICRSSFVMIRSRIACVTSPPNR
uniref:Uncharacterized protein n=1 Tax=Arundo donax TaxID=35708 RepID=A0A0A9GGS1_ARUDO